MNLLWKCAAIFVLLSLAPGARAQAQATRTIYLVRHADKVSDDTDAPLSDAGRVRAQCLAKTLQDAKIEQIFTSDLQRTQQTAAPLAEQLHLKPVVIPISKAADVAAAVRASTARSVLVVWHDQTLPGILRGLGAPEITPIGHQEYDRFFVVTLPGEGKDAPAGFAALRYCLQ
jgi:hypothetical protein